VGGTGKLPMADLKAMCETLGFTHVRTYIASGNVVFQAGHDAAKVRATLEKALHDYAGKPVGVHVRSPAELRNILADNPFSQAVGNRNIVIFLDAAAPPDALTKITGQGDEHLALGVREIYIHYGDDMGHSKLKIPAAKHGTARNMNTVAKLAEMADAVTSRQYP
jgi:uncharacterized protein (DUF1697 family)